MSEETKTCPKCEGPCERDGVDVGVGTIFGPWYCLNQGTSESCGWEEAPRVLGRESGPPMMPAPIMFSPTVVDAIDAEIAYAHGLGPDRVEAQERPHTTGDYLTMLTTYLRKAQDGWTLQAGDRAALHTLPARERLPPKRGRVTRGSVVRSETLLHAGAKP